MQFRRFFIFFVLFIVTFSTITYANSNKIPPDTYQIAPVSSKNCSVPSINSKSAIVLDRSSKAILYSKNEKQTRKMASTTKIMTCIVVLENANLYDTVTISKKAARVGGSKLGIKAGNKVTVCDLLYGLMLKSGNDAAIALAEHVGGNLEDFAKLMNKKAQELNLKNTHFVTPHGLDNNNHYTTAYELALLTDYALNNKTFCNLVNTKSYTVTINGHHKTIKNTNELLGTNGVYGVKTGFTNGANRCLVTACRQDILNIICVVLGADTKSYRTKDSLKLINYTFKTYEMVDLQQLVINDFNAWKTKNLSNFYFVKAVNSKLKLDIKNFNYTLYPIKKEHKNNISTSIDCTYTQIAPLKAGSTIGNINVNVGGGKILSFEIINTVPIEKKHILDFLVQILANYFEYLT